VHESLSKNGGLRIEFTANESQMMASGPLTPLSLRYVTHIAVLRLTQNDSNVTN